jgi:hypothetical protein
MEILHFDSLTQAANYFVLCFISILGVIQLSAARSGRDKFLWFDERASTLLGGFAAAASFVWFFMIEEGIFIPGLAGGEMIALFAAAYVTAVPISRAVAILFARLRLSLPAPRIAGVKEPTL